MVALAYVGTADFRPIDIEDFQRDQRSVRHALFCKMEGYHANQMRAQHAILHKQLRDDQLWKHEKLIDILEGVERAFTWYEQSEERRRAKLAAQSDRRYAGRIAHNELEMPQVVGTYGNPVEIAESVPAPVLQQPLQHAPHPLLAAILSAAVPPTYQPEMQVTASQGVAPAAQEHLQHTDQPQQNGLAYTGGISSSEMEIGPWSEDDFEDLMQLANTLDDGSVGYAATTRNHQAENAQQQSSEEDKEDEVVLLRTVHRVDLTRESVAGTTANDVEMNQSRPASSGTAVSNSVATFQQPLARQDSGYGSGTAIDVDAPENDAAALGDDDDVVEVPPPKRRNGPALMDGPRGGFQAPPRPYSVQEQFRRATHLKQYDWMKPAAPDVPVESLQAQRQKGKISKRKAAEMEAMARRLEGLQGEENAESLEGEQPPAKKRKTKAPKKTTSRRRQQPQQDSTEPGQSTDSVEDEDVAAMWREMAAASAQLPEPMRPAFAEETAPAATTALEQSSWPDLEDDDLFAPSPRSSELFDGELILENPLDVPSRRNHRMQHDGPPTSLMAAAAQGTALEDTEADEPELDTDAARTMAEYEEARREAEMDADLLAALNEEADEDEEEREDGNDDEMVRDDESIISEEP